MGAGLLDLWRNPKTDVYAGTQAANQPRIAAIRVFPRNVYAEQGTTIHVIGVNDLAAIHGTLKMEVGATDGRLVYSKAVPVHMPSGIAPLLDEPLDTAALKGTYTVRARVVSENGATLASNTYAFDVFAPDQLLVPGRRVAVHDPWNDLRPFLKQAGIGFEEFTNATDRSLPVFVSRTEARTRDDRARFAELTTFAAGGGTVVYLGGGGERYGWGKPVAVPDYLPVKGGTKLARGTWAPITHLVHDHPIFQGLPSNCMMGSIYENVWAELSLVGVEGETVAGAIGLDWFPELDKNRRHYYGPGDTWHGSDVVVVPVGEGRCILSQLRLIDFLGRDPVADRILYNLIEWADE
jgi:hypothetical protein